MIEFEVTTARAGCLRTRVRGHPARAVVLVGMLLALAALTTSCGANRPAGKAAERRYELRGRVVFVDTAASRVTIEHDEIPDYMDAMTMPFDVREAATLSALAPGDRVTATLVVGRGRSWLEGLRVVGSEEQGTVLLPAEPNPGDRVPSVALVNQSGAPLRLDAYEGKALLVTFIYTRCPLPDYCILMSDNFQKVERALRETPALYDRTHLVSVSVDPDYDTPDVLATYGKGLMPGEQRFDHWEFATGTPEQVRTVAGFFGLSYETQSGQIVHSLRTAVVDPRGKVFEIFRGNEWKPEDALASLRRALE